MGLAGLCHRPFGEGCTAQNAGLCHRPFGEGCTAQNAGLCHRPFGEGCTAQNAGLCHRPLGEGCTAQNAGDSGVALLLQLALPRSGRSTPGSPSSCWALEWTFSASCPAQNSRLALASLPQPDLEVRSLRNAARQYPCARPSVLSPRALERLGERITETALLGGLVFEQLETL